MNVSKSPRWIIWVAIAALVWHILGLAAFFNHISMSKEAFALLTEPEKYVYQNTPIWARAAYAIAVISGVVGSCLLIQGKALAQPVFILSFVAVMVQMYFAFVVINSYELIGVTSAIMPILIIAIATALIIFTNYAKGHEWLT